MSLQDAADYFNRRRNSPVERGISAGQAAYEGERAPAPQRSGIGPVPIADVKSSVQQAIEQAAAQRQVLADTAQKQALGLYPNTGTSAAAYNYLRGAPGAKYPVNPVLAGQPGSALTSPTISKPYESATTVGGKTQTDIAKTGDQKPPISRAGYGPQAVRQPGLLDQLTSLALPAYLGYKAYQYFTTPSAAEAGISAALNPYAKYAADSAATVTAAPQAAGIIESTALPPLTDAGTTAGTTAGATAGTELPAGYDYVSGEPITSEAATALAASSVSPEVLAAANASADPIAYLAEAQGWTTAETAAASNAMTSAGVEGSAFYGIDPTTAAIAAVVLSTPAGRELIQSLGEAGQKVIDTATGFVEDLGGFVGNAGSEAEDWVESWFAKGGVVKGISATLPRRFDEGGETDTPDNPLIPRFADTNALGRVLDDDLVNQYDKATKAGNTSKAKALRKEIDYRNRMRSAQTTPMATGGLSAAAYNLGGYSDGGRLLKGPGDGVSDSIPATIGKNRQPARLADGEFVVPARIVSELGNGSTEAGARKLYAMMDRIQKSRKKSIGKGKVAVNSRADKNLPA